MMELKLDHDHPRWLNPWQLAYFDESSRHQDGTKITLQNGESFDVRNPPEEVRAMWMEAMGGQELIMDEASAAALAGGVAETVADAVKG